ncbi:MAG: hypothetical protein ACFFDI_03640 [Promethearchaeota archaeon]
MASFISASCLRNSSFRNFLFETLWIGLIGSALGIILGWILSNIFGLVLGNMMTGGFGGDGGDPGMIGGVLV